MRTRLWKIAALLSAVMLLTACGDGPDPVSPQGTVTGTVTAATETEAVETAAETTETTAPAAEPSAQSETEAPEPAQGDDAEEIVRYLLEYESDWLIPAYPEYLSPEDVRDFQIRKFTFIDLDFDGDCELIVGGNEMGQMTDHCFEARVYKYPRNSDGAPMQYAEEYEWDGSTYTEDRIFSDETLLTLVSDADGSNRRFFLRTPTPDFGSSLATYCFTEILPGEVWKNSFITQNQFQSWCDFGGPEWEEKILADYGAEAQKRQQDNRTCEDIFRTLREVQYDCEWVRLDQYNALSKEEKLQCMRKAYRAFRVGEMRDAAPYRDILK